MPSFKYLIIGGGIAGVTAAETIRSKDKDGSIAIISDEPYHLYSRVMLSKPNFFLGKIPFESIYIKDKAWYETNRVEFLGNKIVTKIDAQNKKVIVSQLSAAENISNAGGVGGADLGGGNDISYEKLLVATGVTPRRSTIPGADKKGVHYLRTLEDGQKIMENLKSAKNAITVGGGFISFEMADLMCMAGLKTTLLLRESYFWEPVLDLKSGHMIEAALTKGGVDVLKNSEAASINGGESVESVTLKDGRTITCDLIVFGIGVTNNNLEMLKRDGFEMGHGILANEYLETNLPNVWTAGDIADYNDLLLEEHVVMGNWVNGREQGRISGLNMVASANPELAQKTAFRFVSFYTTQGFGITIAFVGDTAPGADRIIIPRGSPEINSYARILVVGKEIIGATMINRTGDMTSISKLIEKNVDVSGIMEKLGDVGVEMKEIARV